MRSGTLCDSQRAGLSLGGAKRLCGTRLAPMNNAQGRCYNSGFE